MGKDNDKNNTTSTPNNKTIPRETQLKKTLYEEKRLEIKRMYWVHMTSVRLLFKNDAAILIQLLLVEKHDSRIYPWTQQAKEFYRKVIHNETILERLTEYGIRKENLELAQLKLKELEGNKFWKKQCDDEWTEGEYKLQESFLKLQEWMDDFEETSREAFKDQPEYLVKLGFEKSVEDALERQKKDERRKWKKIGRTEPK